MKYIFIPLFISTISLRAQNVYDSLSIPKDKSGRITEEPKYISFSDLPRLKKAQSNHRVISSVNVSASDTLLFSLATFNRRIYSLPNTSKSQNIKQITHSCSFIYCIFQGFDFSEITFNKDANFAFSSFDSFSIFSQTVFNQDASFVSAYFENRDIFKHSRFKAKAIFDRAQFESGLNLNLMEFDGEVSFRKVDFSKGLSFHQVVFHRVPDFSDIQLPLNLIFYDVSFKYDQLADQSAKIDFSSAKLDYIRADNKIPNIKCLFQASRTDFSRLILPYDRFTLVFYDETKYEEKISAYETIIKSCREAGLTESVKGWDVEYRKLQNTHKFGWFGYILNLFNEQWWNFGHDKWRILVIWLPFFFGCFLVYNFFYIDRLWEKMYKDQELGKVFRKPRSHIEPPNGNNWQRFSFAFFYTAVIYFGFKIRHEAVNYKYTRGLLYLYLMYAVGTIHMAFAFSYILSAY